MLAFEHCAITVGVATLISGIIQMSPKLDTLGKRGVSNGIAQTQPMFSVLKSLFLFPQYWIINLCRFVDIRLLFIGALLPDIIDKPIGLYVFRDTFSNGRIFAHTLLFWGIITVGGMILRLRYRQDALLVLSFGTIIHLILDSMWNDPRTLFWPLLGFSFDKIDAENWSVNIINALFTNPSLFLFEMTAAILIMIMVIALIRTGKLFMIMRYGKIT